MPPAGGTGRCNDERVRHRHADQPPLITDAPASPDDEYERRRKRYAIMMATRAICVVAAALTYHVSIWLAVGLVVGGAVLPWSAVIMANDRPPKRRRRRGLVVPPSDHALPAAPDDRTIEG